MKRNDASRKVIDLGKASRETKGSNAGVPETIGLLQPYGLSND